MTDVLHGFKMALGGVVDGLGLHECGCCRVEIAAGNRAFCKQLFAAGDDGLV